MSHRKTDLGIPCPRKICQSSARPRFTGSSPLTKTMGIVAVARLAASTAVGLANISKLGWRRTRSAISAGIRSNWPSAERYSIFTFWPSTKPDCIRPVRNDASGCRIDVGAAMVIIPMIAGVCARAAKELSTAAAAAALPSSVVNWRLFIRSPRPRELLKLPRHVKTERLGSLEVDHQLELRRLLDWQLLRFGSLEDAVDVACCETALFDIIVTIGDQAARSRKIVGGKIDRRATVSGRERNDEVTISRVE